MKKIAFWFAEEGATTSTLASFVHLWKKIMVSGVSRAY